MSHISLGKSKSMANETPLKISQLKIRVETICTGGDIVRRKFCPASSRNIIIDQSLWNLVCRDLTHLKLNSI